MADNHSPEARSYNMSRIRSKDTAPEEKVRKWLFSKGFRYRKHVKSLCGCPDIVLPKYKTVVFVHGCFWHVHDCGRFRMPTSNQEYWKPKLIGNVERDKANQTKLRQDGWAVIVVWECELKKDRFETTMKRLESSIRCSYHTHCQ